jgi:hypothetical protein
VKIVVIGGDNDTMALYSDLFNYQIRKLPWKYLAVLLTFSNLKNIDCDFLDAELIKKLDAWIYDSASCGDRLTFLDSTLSGIPSYYMAMFLLNKTFVENWINTEGDSFGLEKKSKKLIIWLNVKEFVDLKIKGVLGLRTLEKKTLSSLLSGGGSWKLKMGFGRGL